MRPIVAFLTLSILEDAMQLVIGERVQHALRHLDGGEATKMEKVFSALTNLSADELSKSKKFAVRSLKGLGKDVFELRATPHFRLLFRLRNSGETLVVEDLASPNVLKQHLGIAMK